jgi:hypothetical protein
MKTLKQIEQEAEAQRTYLWKRGKLVEAVENARQLLASTERKLAEPEPGLASLQTMFDLVGTIPQGLITRGTFLTAGGAGLRETLMVEIGHALNQLTAKRKALQDSLPIARQRVANAEQALATLDGTRQTIHGTLHAKVDIKASGNIEVRQ